MEMCVWAALNQAIVPRSPDDLPLEPLTSCVAR